MRMSRKNDYHDYDRIEDPFIVRKQQKYKTWLYVILLAVCLYVLFYGTLRKTESKTIIISNITPDIFNQLYFEHNQTLSCPCSTITIPYKKFLSNNITLHPVCSSIFISKEWIEGLYFKNASSYGIWDFRKIAYSQFELLSKFCSLSQSMISQIEIDVNNTEFITINLLSSKQIQMQIDNTIDFEKSNAFDRMISFLNYWRTTSDGNYLVSALGTNWRIATIISDGVSIGAVGSPTEFIDQNGALLRCGTDNPIISAVLPPLSNDSRDLLTLVLFTSIPNSTIVKGFFMGCTPLDALLASTLDCLYEIECIQMLWNYFPNLTQTNFNWNNSILSSKQDNKSVFDYVQNFFLKNWSSTINYSIYFDQCSPLMCTYTRTDRADLIYAITLFISLYGGLIIILRLVSSYIINAYFKFKYLSTGNLRRQKTNKFKTVQAMKQLNLFKTIQERTEANIKQQRIVTRIYLSLLFGSILIICLSTSLSNDIVKVTVPNPSLTTYNSLEMIYSTTLRCPCTNQTISYRTFISFSPTFHQICSSGFVHNDWITVVMKNSRNGGVDYDWRNKAYIQFRILSNICQLANKTINSAIDKFLSQFFISSSVINEMDFNAQLSTYFNQFYQSTIYNFDLTKDIIQLILQVNQFHVGAPAISDGDSLDLGLVIDILANETNNDQNAQVKFILNSIQDVNTQLSICVCATNPYCQRLGVISDANSIVDKDNISINNHNISGWIEGCSPFDSLLLSTLQCLYDDSDCFRFLLNYISKINTDSLTLSSSLYRIKPLIYDPTMSHYPPNTSISMTIKELMIEQWNPSSSYKQFYESCAPLSCSYSLSIHKQNFLGVIVILASMIGGIVVSLRILTPYLVKCVIKLTTIFNKKSNQTEQVHRNCIDQLRITIQYSVQFLHNTLIEFNIFTSRDLGSDADRVTAKYYGRWATQIYGEQLQCSCSRIASTYQQFVNIQPIFHSICSSKFVSEQWRTDLINGLVSNLSIYEQRDYRRFLSSHLQYLQGLCQLSMKTVNNSINEFLTSLLISSELLSENIFHNRLNILIEQRKSNAPVLFSRLLFFTQNIIHGNAFMSTYGTNFEYNLKSIGFYSIAVGFAQALIYDDQCSCGLSPNCTIQATFIETNSSQKISIKGMKMGCTPGESFLASTLECFYDQSCLDLIQQYTNYHNSSPPLLITSNYFSQNTTNNDLMHNLFIEQ
ncbi:hypothetical protein I4U23_022622 [Adineta vaga]|nr:hypothetical protein I4U23_022622 [Adineta vaga]